MSSGFPELSPYTVNCIRNATAAAPCCAKFPRDFCRTKRIGNDSRQRSSARSTLMSPQLAAVVVGLFGHLNADRCRLIESGLNILDAVVQPKPQFRADEAHDGPAKGLQFSRSPGVKFTALPRAMILQAIDVDQ